MRFLRNHPEPFGRDCRGTSILEMAVILPVLLTISLGVFEFGNLIYSYHLITVGVRDGARYAAGLPQGTADSAAISIAVTGTDSGGTNRVSWWDTGDVSISYTSVANDDGSGNKLYRGGASIVMVTVSTDVGYQPLGFLGYLDLETITLHAQHEERLFGGR